MIDFVFAAALALLSACSPPGGAPRPLQEGFQRVSTAQGARLARLPGLFLLDVRTREEFATGHLPGAVLIPVDELARRLDELPRDRGTPVLVYCGSGPRARTAAALLAQSGYTKVSELEGGVRAWRAERRPLAP